MLPIDRLRPRVRPQRLRPDLEALEARRLLVTFMVTNTNNSGPGSLRDAITSANGAAGPTVIKFAIDSGRQTINLTSELPTITGPSSFITGEPGVITEPSLVIDGTTQPGFTGTPLIELNGAGAGTSANGLTLAAANISVLDLIINRFSGDGIGLRGTAATHDLIAGNLIGTDGTGAIALGNGSGIILNGASANTIGGTTTALRNIISGNTHDGISVSGTTSANLIEGNVVGLNASGTAALGNGTGILIQGMNNTVGGFSASARNVISGNVGDGLQISGPAAVENFVMGNDVGTDITGGAPVGNGANGVSITAPTNQIGGTLTGQGNVVSANGANGIALSGPYAVGNSLFGNLIGTTAAGVGALGNMFEGVLISQARQNSVGGQGTGFGNVISGNGDNGIDLRGAGAVGNVILGNRIGTDASGANPIGNVASGILVELGASGNSIGVAGASAGNQISANQGAGVFLRGSNTSNNFVGGNVLGSPTRRSRRLGNTVGLARLNSFGNRIGRNTIQGNRRNMISGRGFIAF
jgi:hypothetical protein